MSQFATILTHDVADYAAWRKVFDAGQPAREHHGITIQGVYAAADNPNRITVIAKLKTPDALQNFMSDPNAQAEMQKAGVVGAPDVRVMHLLS